VLLAATASTAALASGCGAARQDAHERKGTFALKVRKASFPSNQAVARPASFELQIENAGTHTAPEVAVTLDSFYYVERFAQAQLASSKRPVWVIESGPGAIPSPPVESAAVSPPGGGGTNYVNTWALGPLAPGRTQTFVWRVAPVRAGRYSVHYRIAAGLAGKAKAARPGGGPVQGKLTADIAPAPPARHVNPATGRVVLGALPTVP
jgi:hypothetical protein